MKHALMKSPWIGFGSLIQHRAPLDCGRMWVFGKGVGQKKEKKKKDLKIASNV